MTSSRIIVMSCLSYNVPPHSMLESRPYFIAAINGDTGEFRFLYFGTRHIYKKLSKKMSVSGLWFSSAKHYLNLPNITNLTTDEIKNNFITWCRINMRSDTRIIDCYEIR